MKKIVKIVLAIIVLIAVGIGAKFYLDMPLDVLTYKIASSEASEYFIEQGYVKSDTETDVFSNVSGPIVSLNVSEGDEVYEGQVICIVDSSEYNYSVAQAENNKNGYIAQQKNLDVEDQRRRADLQSSKNSLLNEYNNIVAQEKDYLLQESTALAKELDVVAKENETSALKEEQLNQQIRLQNILIQQNETELKSAEDALKTSKILYDNNVIPKSEYDDAVKDVETKQANLNSSIQQLEVIKAGYSETSSQVYTQTYTEYYDSMKKSIQSKIADIDTSLSKNYSWAMKEYYNTLIDNEDTNAKLLNKKIEDCTIKSPVSGKISTLNIKDTNIVTTQQPIAVITTEKSTDIEVYISTRNYKDVQLGDYVEITQSQASGDIVFDGVIKEIDEKAISQQSSLGIEDRKVKVTIKPADGNEAALFPGFAFDVKFITFKETNQITVPKTAVFKYTDDSSAQDMVWLVQDGKTVMHAVTVGRELRTEYIIESGLSTDDIIIKDASAEGIGNRVKIKTE